MTRTRDLIERVDKLEAEVAELRELLAPKPPPKPRGKVRQTFDGDTE